MKNCYNNHNFIKIGMLAKTENDSETTISDDKESMCMYGGSVMPENAMALRFYGGGEFVFLQEGGRHLERLPFELFLTALCGEFRFVADEKTVVCPEGETLLVPYDTACTLETDGACTVIWIAVDYRIYTNLRIFSLFDLPVRLNGGEAGALCRLIRDTVLDSEFTNSRLENALSVNAALYQLSHLVLACGVPRSEGVVLMERFCPIAPVLAAIEECLSHDLRMEELAGLIDLSEDALYRLFKITVGKSPKEYLLSERMRQACLLLVGSTLSVAEISRRVGYDNPFYFSTLFRQKRGLSPTDYRKKTAGILTI